MTGNENWDRLIGDLYASDEAELERLVRYAADPTALGVDERQQVEARLATDASWSDRLRVLQHFDPATVLDEEVDEAGQIGESADSVAGDPLAEVIPLPRRNLGRAAAWVATAAAAALAVWFGVGISDEPKEAPQSVVEQPSAPLDDPRMSIPSVPAQDDLDRQPVQVAVEVPIEPAADATESIDAEVQGLEKADGFAKAEPRTPSAKLVLTPAVEPHTAESTPDLEGHAATAPMLLARLDPIQYAAPADRALRSAPDGMFRGEGARVSVEAWVPDHVARSATAQPRLYWKLEGDLPATHRLGFAMTSETDPEPLYEGSLALPGAAGRQSIDLAGLGVALEPGTIYRWTVFVRAPSADPAEDRIAQGWVQHQPVPDSLSRQTRTGTLAERAAVYAESGYWYDALQLLVDLEEAHPEDAKPREILASFLAEAGIE